MDQDKETEIKKSREMESESGKEEELIKLRATLRGKVTRLIKDLREFSKGDVDPDRLAYKIKMLEDLEGKLVTVQDELDVKGVKDDTNHLDNLREEVFVSNRLLLRLMKSAESQSGAAGPTAHVSPPVEEDVNLKSSLVVKLPTFEGDVMKWGEFWELYNVSVHANPRYADVQKFVLLKSHLGSLPRQTIEGIPLSEKGYSTAIDILTQRFDRGDVRKETLMRQLLDVHGVSDPNDLKSMHRLIDQVNSRVRGLETLGVSSDSFSSLLLPVIREKLPAAWRLEWARSQPAGAEPEFKKLLDFLQKEVQVREVAGLTPAEGPKPPSTSWATVSGLSAHQVSPVRSAACAQSWMCKACVTARHGLAGCHVYQSQDVARRWEIVKAAGVCFRCLGPHYARDCHSSDCQLCGGPHHTSLHGGAEVRRPSQSAGSERHLQQQRAARYHPPSAPAQQKRGHRLPRPSPPVEHHQPPPSKGLTATIPRLAMHAATAAEPVVHEEPVAPTVATVHEPRLESVLNAASASPSGDADPLHDTAAHCSPCDPPTSAPALRDAPTTREGACFTQTALVEATGPRGTCMLRVLLDGGSDSSYVRTSAAELLGLPTVGSSTFACMGFQERAEEARFYEKVRMTLRSRHGGDSMLMDLWKTDRLCAQLTPARPPAVRFTPHLLLADDFQGGPVDVLIGVDHLYRIVLWDQVRLTDRLRAVETVFGYVLHGREDEPLTSTCVKHTLRCSRLEPSDCTAEQLWSLDAIGISSASEKTREAPEPKRLSDGRYEMGLLWASEERPVSNFGSAAARTRRMERRLPAPEREEYHRHLQELQRAGVVEESPGEVSNCFYLPHRGIWRKNKLRIVFDGSARDATGRSLNEYLSTGGNLLRRLPAVLLNFRRDKVAAQADIRSAFHQVSVAEEDRRFLQFLWQEQSRRFRRVPFGLTCSPFMLLHTISTHLNQYRLTDPEICSKIETGLYMDDVCTSFSSRTEAETGMERTAEVFADAGMELHKLHVTGDDAPDAPVLGLLWSTREDRLAASVPTLPPITTRRELLSTLSKPFDPLGVLSPWLVAGRSLFQRTWTEKPPAGWDEELAPELQRELEAWTRDSSGRAVWFPRAARVTEDATYHVFCDASRRAYCCAIYVVQGRGDIGSGWRIIS